MIDEQQNEEIKNETVSSAQAEAAPTNEPNGEQQESSSTKGTSTESTSTESASNASTSGESAFSGSSSGRQNKKKPFRGKPRNRQPRKEPLRRFINITWSAQREPVDDMFWCEIEKEGDWTTVVAVDQVRSRREILERLSEVEEGIISFDFSFSYPLAFIEFLQETEGIKDWRELLHRVREDLKKNADDGIRLWVERIGKYRETNLDPNWQPRQRFQQNQQNRFRGRNQNTALQPYEQRSMVERFRRTEHAIRRVAGEHLSSSLQVNYNRLTSRYEFADAKMHGRATLLGMAFLDQLLDQKPTASVWPWSKQSKLTILETRPWVFTRGKLMDPQACRDFISRQEDQGLDIDPAYRDLICRNPRAQEAFQTVFGMIKAENREERAIRPIRDYSQEFYNDEKIKAEGWIYGIGYKSADRPERASGNERPTRETTRSITAETTIAEQDTSLSKDLESAAVIPQPAESSYDQAVEEQGVEQPAPTPSTDLS